MEKHEATEGTLVYIDTTDPSWDGSIVGMVKGSHTKVIVEDIDRGIGWDDEKERYTGLVMPTIENGIVVGTGWVRGENADFGTRHEVHIKDCRLK